MKSLHPNELRKNPAFSQECTSVCGHCAHQGVHPCSALEQQGQSLPPLECKNRELLHLTLQASVSQSAEENDAATQEGEYLYRETKIRKGPPASLIQHFKMKFF